MTIEINGGVLGVSFTVFTTVGGFLVWFGLNVLGKINGLSTDLDDVKKEMASAKVDIVAWELRLETKLDKWGERLGRAEVNVGALKALMGVKNDSDKSEE